MTAAPRPRWPRTAAAAVAVQRSLAPRVVSDDRLGPVHRVAGVDVGFDQGGAVTVAAVAVLSFPDLALEDWARVRRRTRFPYVPGLLSFREAPAVLDAMAKLHRAPDLLLCDGHGIAHPRRFGIACHLAVLLDLPSVGVAKSRLTGDHAEPGRQRGAWTPLSDRDTVIGAVLRTRTGVRPVYVSVGHRTSLATAMAFVLACTPRYRLPETTRCADRLAGGAAAPVCYRKGGAEARGPT